VNVPFSANALLNLSSLVSEGGEVIFNYRDKGRENLCALFFCGADLDFDLLTANLFGALASSSNLDL